MKIIENYWTFTRLMLSPTMMRVQKDQRYLSRGLLMHPSYNVPTQTVTFWEAQAKTFSSEAIRREQTLRFHSTNGVSEHKYPPVWEIFPFSSFFSSPKNQKKKIYIYTYIHMKTSTLLTSSFQPLALLTLTLWSWCYLMLPEEQSLLLHASVLSWMEGYPIIPGAS